jgi:hypothetical protein
VIRRLQIFSTRALFVSLLVAGILVLLNHSNVGASTSSGNSITITPSSTELSAPPGGSENSTFSVVNDGSTDYTMEVSVSPYHVVGVSYDPQFSVLPGTTDASKWIQLSGPATQDLGPGKVQNISYTLNVPANTAPGGYYAVIFAESIPPAGKGVTALNRVGDIIYITVDGAVTKTGVVKTANTPLLVTGKSLSIGLIVQDTGGLHFLTNAHIKVTSLFGHVAFEANLQRYVLPQTQRLITSNWASLPVFGIYKINRSATVFGNTQNLPTEWVIIIRPWLLIGIILVVLFIIALGIRKHKSHRGASTKSSRKKTNVRR